VPTGWIRFFGYVAYALIVLIAAYHVFLRSEKESQLRIARWLTKGEAIAATDISSTRIAQVVGHDANNDMKAGSPIGPLDVHEHEPALHPPALAIVLSAEWASTEKPVHISDPINLCLGKEKLSIGEAKVSAAVCDKDNCTITVQIASVPEALGKGDSLKQIRAVKGDQDCGGK
jgi:hypothetical protein